MRLSITGVAVTLWLIFSAIAVEAQTDKVPRVGFLCWVTCGDTYHGAFWQALRSLGYADYKNIAFEYRAAGGDDALLDTLAVQLVDLKPAVIVADTTQSARALKKATQTIALVVIADDPIGSELVSNLARPEGNITGLSLVAVELAAKQVAVSRGGRSRGIAGGRCRQSRQSSDGASAASVAGCGTSIRRDASAARCAYAPRARKCFCGNGPDAC